MGIMRLLTFITIKSETGSQAPLVIVQLKMLSPSDRPLTAVDGAVELKIWPVPETRAHRPVPARGILASSVVPKTYSRTWSGPASGTGSSSADTTTGLMA